MASPTRILQISDLHLFADENKNLLGVNTQESFKAVVSLAKEQSDKIDLILLTGDLSQDGSVSAYKRIAAILDVFDCPVYFVGGNHDNENNYLQVFPNRMIKLDKQLLFPGWQIILLNSQKKRAVEGLLDTTQLSFMEKSLQAHAGRNTIIVLHHQPLSVGSQWLDNVGLSNSTSLWKILTKYPQVKFILFGHVHQAFEKLHQGIHCYALPSTCIQFKPNQIDFALDHQPPGYRWISLHENGAWQTGIVRCPQYIGEFDKHAKGY